MVWHYQTINERKNDKNGLFTARCGGVISRASSTARVFLPPAHPVLARSMKCKIPPCSRIYRVASLLTAGLVIAQAVLTMLSAVLTLAIITPIGWMLVVWAAWHLAFGSLILQMQMGWGGRCIAKWAGFLTTRFGRGTCTPCTAPSPTV